MFNQNNKTTMKKGEIVQRYNDLNTITGLKGIQLLYAVKRNKDILKPIAEQLHHTVLIPASKSYMAYEEQLMALETEKGFDKEAVKELNSKHVDLLNIRNKEIKEYNKVMLEEYDKEIEVFYIPLSVAPDEQKQFDAVAFMISDMDIEIEKKFNELFNSL